MTVANLSDHTRAWIRRLTRVVEWIAGLGFLVHGIEVAGEAHLSDWLPLKPALHLGSSLWAQLIVLAFLASVWALARYPRLRLRLLRLLVGAPRLPSETPMLFRGPQPYGVGDHLPGRQADGEACWLLVEQWPFMVLEGESGSGKSSLLNAVLLAKVQRSFTPVWLRPADDPCRQTIAALKRFARPPMDWPATPEGLAKAISAVADALESDRPMLLCIDQFEELFRESSDRDRSAFLTILRSLIEAGEVRVLAVIRSDFVDLLYHLCREVDPQGRTLDPGHFYILKPFRRAQALEVLRDIVAPITRGNRRLEHELDIFAEALVAELLQPPRDGRLSRDDEKTVLPAEMQMVGTMVESLGAEHFTAASFREHGGRNGLLNAYIEQAKTYVSRKAAVPGDRALLVLRQLIPQTRERPRARTANAIAEILSLPVAQVTRVLDAFADQKLVKPLPADPSVPGGVEATALLYELMHEHLGEILEEVPDPVLRKAREAEASLRHWQERAATVDQLSRANSYAAQLAHFLFQPVPIAETLRLWTSARAPEHRRLLRRSVAAFIAKCFLVAVIPASLLLWTSTERYQIHALMAYVPSVTQSVNGFDLLDRWTEISWRTGNTRQARAAVSQVRGDLNPKTDTATAYLDILDGEILNASGDARGAEERFDHARGLIAEIRDESYPFESNAVRFLTAGRLAEALARTRRSGPAADVWRSAFAELRRGRPSNDESVYARSIAVLRGMRGMPDAAARRLLWLDAADAFRQSFAAPLNCVALSDLAFEISKDGDAANATSLWDAALRAVDRFTPMPPREAMVGRDVRREIPIAGTPPTERAPRVEDGMMVEVGAASTAQDVHLVRAYTLVRIAERMYSAGRQDAGRSLWIRALADGVAIERAIAVSRAEPTVTARIGRASQRDKPPVPPPPPPPPGVATRSPLYFYDYLGETVYHAKERWLDAEHAIASIADKRVDEPPARATTLIYSAGRLYAANHSAADKAWRAGLAAATEIRQGDVDAGDTRGRPAPPEPARITTEHEESAQVQTALTGTRDPGLRAAVLQAAAVAMKRYARAETDPSRKVARLAAGIEIARGITDEIWRRSFLQQSALEWLDAHEPGADTLLEELRQELRATRDDTRSYQLAWLAELEAKRGQFQRARRLCWPSPWLSIIGEPTEGCRSEDKLYAAAQILWEYWAKRDSAIGDLARRRAARSVGGE